MIELSNIRKVYRSSDIETIALSAIDLSIQEGEFVSIMGASGCGKSSLLNIIGLLDSIDKGSYRLNNQEMAGLNEKQRGKIRKNSIGFIFQNFNLIDELTVYENVELPLIYIKVSKAERKQRTEQLLNDMKLIDRSKYYPQQLSGGQRQRVAVARALITEPRLILADEPTGNLDSKNGNEVMELLSDLHRKGSTIIMVTHSAYDAGFSNRIIELNDGQIISERANKRQIDIIQRKPNQL